MNKLMLGNNLESLKLLEDNSIDSIVTDPPYGLSFMNKKWDYDVPSVEFWKEVYRVLKPGGHILSFGGTRTYHRMVVNIEDAGFEIRDQIMWLYGSGFPKSHNVAKAIDAKLETKEAQDWKGWGTALKPANEPICLARKPLSEKSVALNVLKWKTGGINIDGCRVAYTEGSHPRDLYGDSYMKSGHGKANGELQSISGNERNGVYVNDEGRFPANIILDEIAGEMLDEQSGVLKGSGIALKPDNEPICLARKPLSEKSVAENVLKWGTGGLNIDGCRVGFNGDKPKECELVDFRGDGSQMNLNASGKERKTIEDRNYIPNEEGRFPANIILECICDEVIKGEKGKFKKTIRSKSGQIYGGGKGTNVGETFGYTGDKGDIHTNPNCVCYLLDEQSGFSKSNCKSEVVEGKDANIFNDGENKTSGHKKKIMVGDYSDKGGASRFFYQAKVSKKERNMGLDLVEEKEVIRQGLAGENNNPVHKNSHPTVKPVNLMAYLCRLITPPDGIVLDPFMGSGSTGIAARLEGFNFIGMEMDENYYKIAEARINDFESYRQFIKK